ncbi:MAG: hypothetical protein M3Q76_10695 [Acidobacteriota bacterium]|nr:hypothetical protein [Acidobacteriota bacterium]
MPITREEVLPAAGREGDEEFLCVLTRSPFSLLKFSVRVHMEMIER